VGSLKSLTGKLLDLDIPLASWEDCPLEELVYSESDIRIARDAYFAFLEFKYDKSTLEMFLEHAKDLDIPEDVAFYETELAKLS